MRAVSLPLKIHRWTQKGRRQGLQNILSPPWAAHERRVSLGFHIRREECFKTEKTGILVRLLSGEGKVVSVYPKAFNIRHRDGLLVSLVGDAKQMTALGLHVPSFFQSAKAETEASAPAWFQKGRLMINGSCIDLAEGALWEGRLTWDSVAGFFPGKTSILEESLLLRGKRGGLLGLMHPSEEQNPFVDRASQALRRILNKARKDSSLGGLSQLMGLGPGLTPSGDDFIAGVLLGERILSLLATSPKGTRSAAQQAIVPLEVNKRDMWDGLRRTNDAGRTLLFQTLQGHFPCYLIEAAKGVGGAHKVEEIADAVGRAVSHGETSGTDALVGLLFYLKAAANHQRRR